MGGCSLVPNAALDSAWANVEKEGANAGDEKTKPNILSFNVDCVGLFVPENLSSCTSG